MRLPTARSASPIRALARCATAALLGALIAAQSPPLRAQDSDNRRIGLIRDAETEALLAEYAAPILKAAGLRQGATRIVLVNDRTFNAFIASGQKIFINVGALMDAATPNEVIGVVAHETGHIAGAHSARLRQQLNSAKVLAVVGMLAGGAAVVGAANSGGRVGNTGTGAMGALTAGPELVRRNLLSYMRSEEQAADLAALRYLTATGQSPKGMLDTFAKFADNGLFRSRSVDPYLMSHPLPTERISQLERLAKESPSFNVKDPPELQARHDLMRAKLFGFVDRPEGVLRRYPTRDTSAPARYARAVVAYKSSRSAEALSAIEALIAEQPGNAYFHELKGQVLLETGRARQAVDPLRKAVSLAPSGAPIRAMLGQALVASGDPAHLNEAIRELSEAAKRDPEAPEPYRALAQAYGRKGDIGQAELASAEAYFNSGDLKNAQTQAYRAMAKLKAGSPAYRKAEDILTYRPPGMN